MCGAEMVTGFALGRFGGASGPAYMAKRAHQSLIRLQTANLAIAKMELVTDEHGGWNGDQTLLFNASALMVFAQLGLGQRERSEGQTGGRARHTVPQCHLPPLSSTDVLGT